MVHHGKVGVAGLMFSLPEFFMNAHPVEAKEHPRVTGTRIRNLTPGLEVEIPLHTIAESHNGASAIEFGPRSAYRPGGSVDGCGIVSGSLAALLVLAALFHTGCEKV